jgi:Kdo2-lipid IVA lauroyltransferase/acyltransferase
MSRRRILRRFRRDSAFLLIRAAVVFFRLLPRRAALAVGSSLGRIAPLLFRREYRLAVSHLTLAFGNEKSQSEIRRIARESLRNAALNFTDTARIGAMTEEEIRSVCVPHDMDRAFAQLRKDRGVVCVSAHTGCWEMLGSYFVLSGIPSAVIARKLYDPRLETLLHRSRTGAGMRVISRGEDTRNIVRALREGYFLGILIDQDISKTKGVFTDFFGMPALTVTAPAFLALRYDLPVMPIFTWRDENHRHHFSVGEPIPKDTTGDQERDIALLTARCSEAVESFIRGHPEQWVWFHQRWKTTPPETEGKGGVRAVAPR